MILICIAIALFATISGAVTGMGGGVIIKPMLDVTGTFSATSVGLLSAFTIFTMACTSVIRRTAAHDTPYNKATFTLGAGSVIGGILGDLVFHRCVNSFAFSSTLICIQSFALILCLVFVLIYMDILRKKGVAFKIKNCLVGLPIGIILGAVSVFIGVGGGPINVAVLCLLLSMDMKSASFNSLVMIIFSQGAKIIKALLFHHAQLTDLQAEIVIAMCIAAVFGGLIGTAINKKISNSAILCCYNILMALIIALALYNAASSILISIQ